MQTLFRAIVLALLVAFACETAAQIHEEREVVEIPERIPAYSTKSPHPQRGFFPGGAKLTIMERLDNGMLRVRFRTASGKVMEGLCQPADLGQEAPAPPKARSARIARKSPPIAKLTGTEYKNREWLEGYAGHKEAVRAQSKYEVPMVLYFYNDWSEECRFLWRELLKTVKFKNRSKSVIKVKINPADGKKEGQLAAHYRVRCFPTVLVVDQPRFDPRGIDLVFDDGGSWRTDDHEWAMAKIMSYLDDTRLKELEAERQAEEKERMEKEIKRKRRAGQPLEEHEEEYLKLQEEKGELIDFEDEEGDEEQPTDEVD